MVPVARKFEYGKSLEGFLVGAYKYDSTDLGMDEIFLPFSWHFKDIDMLSNIAVQEDFSDAVV